MRHIKFMTASMLIAAGVIFLQPVWTERYNENAIIGTNS